MFETNETRRAIWRKIWRDLPLTIGTIMAANILPTLIFWRFPDWRTKTMYTVWAFVTSIVAAGYSMTVGPVEANGRMQTFWSPSQIIIAVIINLLLVAAVMLTFNYFLPIP